MNVKLLIFPLLLATTAAFPAAGPADIFDAINANNMDAVQQFLNENPAAVNQSANGPDNFRPLHCAVAAHNEAAALLLLAHGADVNQRAFDGNIGTRLDIATPLRLAIFLNDEAMVRLLLKNGADINLKNEYGDTPLQYSIQQGPRQPTNSIVIKNTDFIARASEPIQKNKTLALLQQWQRLVAHAKAAKLAFCSTLHPRLGANSFAHMLPQPVMQKILRYVQPKDFAMIPQPTLLHRFFNYLPSTRRVLTAPHPQPTAQQEPALRQSFWSRLPSLRSMATSARGFLANRRVRVIAAASVACLATFGTWLWTHR